MQANRFVALIHPAAMKEARDLGLTNFSGFVNAQLKEYIAVRKAALRKIDSETATAHLLKGAT